MAADPHFHYTRQIRRFEMSLYVCSDIHGQYGLYLKMLDAIRFSGSDSLYILGDIIDRGPDSISLLRDVVKRDNVTCLLGNHELMMYTYFRIPGRPDYWFNASNGGLQTCEEFEMLPSAEQDSILDYIGDMYLQVSLAVNDRKFLLSHSDFLPGKGTMKWAAADYDEAFNVVWNSPWRIWEYTSPEKYRADGLTHVIGHVPVQYAKKDAAFSTALIDHENNLINIDLGCARMSNADWASARTALCCMDITAYAAGEGPGAFTYFRP